ncbi:MAG: pyridoxine 5'-phosphate synthase [Chitinophagaceae bacterium]|nr:pyridoxine 5'-phosphate synthase [Chitinophagaceae bacterium]
MTHLSVNINKLATLRNARGGNNPDIIHWAKRIQQFGANGITVHPRPDERHIRYQDVYDLRHVVNTEFNIEGNPHEGAFVELVLAVKPEQVTLVPDARQQLTSNHGWDTLAHRDFLQEKVQQFQAAGIRVSIFVDPIQAMIEGAKLTGTNRIELYTESYAKQFATQPKEAVRPYSEAANLAHSLGLALNAGHDLDLHNLRYFNQHVKGLAEVSIGHALICDALEYGMENTVVMYKRCLQ